MALSTENANLVWQKVKIALESLGAKPSTVDAFKVLKTRLATVNANPDLQFVAIADLTGDTAVADVACKLYGVFVKKQATATAASFKLNNSTTTAGGASGAAITDVITLGASGQEAHLVFPTGRAQTTGIAIASETNAVGGSDTSTGDGPNGFIILGKA